MEAERLTVVDNLDETLSVKRIVINDVPILKQLQYLEKRFIETKWPDFTPVEGTISDIFERIKVVRDTNKKHI
jgi:hypothetical protein